MFKRTCLTFTLMFTFAVPAQAEFVVGDTFLPDGSAVQDTPVIVKVTTCEKVTRCRSINVTSENTQTASMLIKAPVLMIVELGADTAERPNNDGFVPFEVGWRTS